MRKTTKLKALALMMILAIGALMPFTANAQTVDGFFRGGDDNGETRGDMQINSNTGSGMSNYGIGENDTPLGSGLLVMVAAGAGYAIARRRRSHKSYLSNSSYILLAFVLLLGMTQCKKRIETVSDNTTGMFITLTIDDDSKVIVNPHGHISPNYATVTFQEGDVIYVGHNRKYVGQLTFASGAFSGTIDDSNLTANDYFHFYFMGNKTPRSQSETNITVDIIDQTAEYPVISYAHSTQKYGSGKTSYKAKLRNYCSIMKFTTTDIGANKAVKITGMNNLVAVSFTTNFGDNPVANPYTYGTIDDGIIIMHTETATERWAIVLPNSEGVTATATAAGWGATATQQNLNKVSIPAIGINEYKDNGGAGYPINLAANGIVDGKISVSDSKQIYAAAGNLQYIGSETPVKWKFADNQWDMIGASQGTADANADRDLFGWGTSGWNNLANDSTSTNYQPYSVDNTSYSSVSDSPSTNTSYYNPTHYGPAWKSNSNYSITGTNYDWGIYHSPANGSLGGGSLIDNGGGLAWRKSLYNEGMYWGGAAGYSGLPRYLVINGNYVPKIGYGKVMGVNGLLILPDNWDGSLDPNFTYAYSDYANEYDEDSSPRWSAMEAYGVVFLPAAGFRDGTTVSNVGTRGYYWASDAGEYNSDGHHSYNNLREAFLMEFYSNGVTWEYQYRYFGGSVRLYHDIN